MTKCYHQSVMQYDQFEDPESGEICYADFEICKDCNAVIFNDKVIGYDNQITEQSRSNQE